MTPLEWVVGFGLMLLAGILVLWPRPKKPEPSCRHCWHYANKPDPNCVAGSILPGRECCKCQIWRPDEGWG